MLRTGSSLQTWAFQNKPLGLCETFTKNEFRKSGDFFKKVQAKRFEPVY